jgi:hypothetical protein
MAQAHPARSDPPGALEQAPVRLRFRDTLLIFGGLIFAIVSMLMHWCCP